MRSRFYRVYEDVASYETHIHQYIYTYVYRHGTTQGGPRHKVARLYIQGGEETYIMRYLQSSFPAAEPYNC